MKNIFKLIFLVLLTTPALSIMGQGCVAIRGGSSCGGNMASGGSTILGKGDIDVQIGVRHFKSYKHFRGDVEEVNRVQEGTEVINNSTFTDLSLTWGVSDRIFLNALIPFVFHNRSSMYEHGGNPPKGLAERHETSSRGLSDIRLGIGYWLFDAYKHNYNYAVGIGLKLPTGNYNYQDVFYNQGANKEEDVKKVVDQSIQPGDGGLGVTLEVQGFHPFTSSFGLSTSLYYLFNFQGTNGVLTRNGNSEFSCPDQFASRVGAFYNLPSGLNLYLGGRIEGVPAIDAIGASDGYRRPGYAVSVDPGIGFANHKFSATINVPIAVYRNRIQSFQDKERTRETGVYRHGDAAFADFLINVAISYRFNTSAHEAMEVPLQLD